MNDSYLIQRLKRPFKNKHVLDNPFAFGGGLKNGGLSENAMKILRDIFQFDYMGSAEFEFGAVPETLQVIAKTIKDYVAFTIPKVNYKHQDYLEDKYYTGMRPVYVICNKDWQEEVTKRIKAKALGDYNKSKHNFRTKEVVRLGGSLAGSKYDRDIAGWLELSNGYFFFTDKDMFSKVCSMLGINQNE